MSLQRTPTLKEAEAYGLLRALDWIRDGGFFNITIELDFKPVIDEMLEKSFLTMNLVCLYKQIVTIQNFSKATNQVAHNLA